MPAFPATEKSSVIAADGRYPALPIRVMRATPVNPLAINDLTITTTHNTATFHFTPPPEVNTSYLFQVATGTSWGGDRYASAASGADGEYDYTGLTPNAVHKGRVFVNGAVSNVVDFVMDPPLAITDLTVTTTDTTADYDFTRIPDATSYTFQRSLDGGTWTGDVVVSAASLPAGPYTVEPVTESTNYYWRVLSDGIASNVVYEPTKATEVVEPPPSDTFAGTFVSERIVPTWDDRTKTASPTATVDGDGTDASPWTFEQAQALYQPGDIVGLLPGQWYGTQPNVQDSDLDVTPAFRPLISGTEANPVWFVAQYSASTNSTNRTEIYSGATVERQGWPAFGTRDVDHVKFVGIYSSSVNANGQIRDDSGLVSTRGVSVKSDGCGVYKCHLVGKPNLFNNNSAVRVEFIDRVEVADNVMDGFTGTVNNTGVTLYHALGVRIHHNDIKNCGCSVYSKQGTIGYRYYNNKVEDCTRFFRFSAPTAEDANGRDQAWIYNNIADNIGYIYEATTGNGGKILDKGKLFNNTFNNVTTADDPIAAIWWATSPPDELRDNKFFNNILHTSYGLFGSYQGNPATIERMAKFIQSNRNVFQNLTKFFKTGPMGVFTEADWQAGGQDVDSVFGNPLFTDRAGNDFTLQAGSPAIGLGRDIYGQFGPVDGVVNAGARPLNSAEVIGVRP